MVAETVFKVIEAVLHYRLNPDGLAALTLEDRLRPRMGVSIAEAKKVRGELAPW